MARRDLSTVTCGDLVAGQHLVTLDLQLTLHEATEILKTKGISAAPVYDKSCDEYYGILDYQRIATAGLALAQEEKAVHIFTNHTTRLDSLWKTVTLSIIPRDYPPGLSKVNPIYKVQASDPLAVAYRLYADAFEKGTYIHRVMVMCGDEPAGLMTQTDILKFVRKNRDDLNPAVKSVLNRSLTELQLVHERNLLTIPKTTNLLTALSTMSKKRLSSAAVCNPDGTFYGGLSFSSIRSTMEDGLYTVLAQTVEEFLKQQTKRNVIFSMEAMPSSQLITAVKTMLDNQVHRVIVVEDDKPVGAVTITDVLRHMFSNVSQLV